MNEDDNKISIMLTAYQWHNLLEELEDRLCVVNIDRKNLVEVYEAIAGQLRGGPVRVILNYPKEKEEKKKAVGKLRRFWGKLRRFWGG